ncbi:MAG: hypothetical protein WEF86_02355 [Gemmatimonadota bacterium]
MTSRELPDLLLARTRDVLEILSTPDTGGVGALLHEQFTWQRFPAARGLSYSSLRLRADPHYLDRMTSGLPLLEQPVPSHFDMRRMETGAAMIVGHNGCTVNPDCRPRPRIRIHWRLTEAGWKIISLEAAGERRS